jgi:predicted Rossmann-fold nucleotide-binding protein
MRLEFETADKLALHLADSLDLRHAVFQGVDLTPFADPLAKADLRDVVLLGCVIPESLQKKLFDASAFLFPNIPNTPFAKYRGLLYTPEELQDAYQPGDHDSYQETLDGRIYEHFKRSGPNPDDAVEALTRRLHDMAITDAMQEFIVGKRIVAIMGGHSMLRSDPMYGQVALIGRELTQKGYLVTTGGGPGAMEAAHLGAWFATRCENDLMDAVEMLSAAPLYDPIGPWLDAAFAVVDKYPVEDRDACQSLGIPTWLYGHEPPARFALTIAKYFANSVREEGLLAIATGGVIFTPGSAGTIQEIFQDACQNHYNSFGIVSPMVFMGTQYWTETKPVYPLLKHLAADKPYGKLLEIHDDRSDIVAAIDAFESSRAGKQV